MPNYQRYPSMTNQRGDLVRRVTNLENEQGLIARIVALEIAVAALTPKAPWVTASQVVQSWTTWPDDPVIVPAGQIVASPTGMAMSPAAGGFTDHWCPGWATATLDLPASSSWEFYAEVTMPEVDVSDGAVYITLGATRPFDRQMLVGPYGYWGLPDAGYCLALWLQDAKANGLGYSVEVLNNGWEDQYYLFSNSDFGGRVFNYPSDGRVGVRIKLDSSTSPSATYSCKVWPLTGNTEPASWDVSAQLKWPAEPFTVVDGRPSDPGYYGVWPHPGPGLVQITTTNEAAIGTALTVSFDKIVVTSP